MSAAKIITRLSASKQRLNIDAVVASITLSKSNAKKISGAHSKSIAKFSNAKLRLSSDKAITKKVEKSKSNNHVNYSSSDDYKKEKHRLIEAKGRAKRIQLYEELNFAIRELEKKIGQEIPSQVKIIQEDLVDDRRKITKRNDKYNNEDILRKIFVMQHIAMQIMKKREKKQQKQQQQQVTAVETNQVEPENCVVEIEHIDVVVNNNEDEDVDVVSNDDDEESNGNGLSYDNDDEDQFIEPKDMDLDLNTTNDDSNGLLLLSKAVNLDLNTTSNDNNGLLLLSKAANFNILDFMFLASSELN